jgi:hypothetical protein
MIAFLPFPASNPELRLFVDAPSAYWDMPGKGMQNFGFPGW